MTYRIRKLIVYFLAPLVTMLLTLMRIPDFCEKLKSVHPDLGIWSDYFVILATAFIYYYTLWSPLKLFEQQARKRWAIMKDMAVEFENYYDDKFDFNFNIMLAKSAICYYIEPVKKNARRGWLSRKGRRFTLYGKILRVIWNHGNYGLPPDFRITINQGLCGKAFREGNDTSTRNIKAEIQPRLVPTETDAELNNEQKKVMEGIIMSASCPLVMEDRDIDGLRKKVIGVINVESRSRESAVLFLEPSSKENFYKKIVNIARIYLNLHC